MNEDTFYSEYEFVASFDTTRIVTISSPLTDDALAHRAIGLLGTVFVDLSPFRKPSCSLEFPILAPLDENTIDPKKKKTIERLLTLLGTVETDPVKCSFYCYQIHNRVRVLCR